MIRKISGSSLRSALTLALLALAVATALDAQGFRVDGRVLRVAEGDTTGVPGAWVVLHEVTLTTGGPVDSQRTDISGRYRLRAATLDSAANYLVSAEHLGIGYFSRPIPPESLPTGELAPLLVYDTSATTPSIRTAERHVLVRAPGADGQRRVVELFVLANRGQMVRLASDSATPVWQATVPATAQQVELGMSDLAADAIEIEGGHVRVFAPIVPGERELLIGYLLPAGIAEVQVRVDRPVDAMSVLLGDSTAVLTESGLSLRGVEELEGQPLRRYGGDSIPAGEVLRIRFPTGAAPLPVLWIVVPLAALAMVAGAVLVLRRSGTVVVAVEEGADPAVLAAEIAALDAEWKGREDDEYRRRRDVMKARLAAALAARKSAD